MANEKESELYTVDLAAEIQRVMDGQREYETQRAAREQGMKLVLDETARLQQILRMQI